MSNMNPLAYGGITAVIGILIVFIGLTILIVAVSIMGWIFASKNKKKQAKAQAEAAAAAKAAAPVAVEPEPAVEEEVVDDTELIAVIAAAIAAYDNSGKSLVVRKVRKVSGWNNSARTEQVYRF